MTLRIIILRHILTLKRFFLLVLLGALCGILLAKVFPAGSLWYAGAVYGPISLACVVLVFRLRLRLAPLETKAGLKPTNSSTTNPCTPTPYAPFVPH